VESTTERVACVLAAAKTTSHVLTDVEIARALTRFERPELLAEPVPKRSRRSRRVAV
jgi:hypothetical protein